MEDIILGIASILTGIYFIWSTAKKTPSTTFSDSTFRFSYYLGGIMFIIIGLVMILKKIYHLSESMVLKSWIK